MGTKKIEPTIRRTVITLGQEATVEITPQFLDQVRYLCSEISVVEWSGYVFFSTKGSPKNLEKFVIIPYFILPMHKGSAGATEFDDDGALVDLYKEMPELDPFEDTKYKYGKIHSHNSMDVYHSHVDMQDLQDQSEHYDYYFSIIVNNALEIEAKASFVAKLPPQAIKPNKFSGAKDWRLAEEEVLGVIDFDIELEDSIVTVPQVLKDRLKVVKAYKAPVKYGKSVHVIPQSSQGYMLSKEEEEWEAMQSFNKPASEKSVADTVLDGIEVRKYENGKALVTKKLSDMINVHNTATVVAYAINTKSFVEINQMGPILNAWFDNLEVWEKTNVTTYITDVPTAEINQKLETLYEILWDHIAVAETD